jgi:hypothetical protein
MHNLKSVQDGQSYFTTAWPAMTMHRSSKHRLQRAMVSVLWKLANIKCELIYMPDVRKLGFAIMTAFIYR